MRSKATAGRSARARFRQQRIANLKSDWRFLVAVVAMAAAAIAFMAFFGPVGLAIGGWMLGLATALSVFGWMIAFDVRALPWLWGSWGEEQTAAELAKLGPDWLVVHDVPHRHGNWDHIVVGQAGVFVIDTKRLSGQASVTDDGLSSGRTRYAGKAFRGSSIGLRKALEAEVADCPWVQAVVAIWGEFPAGELVFERVAYVSGSRLVEWLGQQPATLGDTRRKTLADAVARLAKGS
jgi:hypothetical protein